MEADRSQRGGISFSEIAKNQEIIRTNPKRSTSEGFLAKIYKYVPNVKLSLFLIVVLQVVILYLFVNPVNLLTQLRSVQILNEVARQANIPPTEIPQMSVIGDNNIPTAEELRKSNAVTAEIYKDASDGDYILLYTNKLVVYSTKLEKVIYDGDTPNNIIKASSEQLLSTIVQKVKDAGLIEATYAETPQAQVVNDAELVKKSDPVFYEDLQANDILATFSLVDGKTLIIVYRPSSNLIIRSGTVTITDL